MLVGGEKWFMDRISVELQCRSSIFRIWRNEVHVWNEA